MRRFLTIPYITLAVAVLIFVGAGVFFLVERDTGTQDRATIVAIDTPSAVSVATPSGGTAAVIAASPATPATATRPGGGTTPGTPVASRTTRPVVTGGTPGAGREPPPCRP